MSEAIISEAMVKYLQDNYCLTFGHYNPRNHVCIRCETNPICQLCITARLLGDEGDGTALLP